jgi:hypothetical protein
MQVAAGRVHSELNAQLLAGGKLFCQFLAAYHFGGAAGKFLQNLIGVHNLELYYF